MARIPRQLTSPSKSSPDVSESNGLSQTCSAPCLFPELTQSIFEPLALQTFPFLSLGCYPSSVDYSLYACPRDNLGTLTKEGSSSVGRPSLLTDTPQAPLLCPQWIP